MEIHYWFLCLSWRLSYFLEIQKQSTISRSSAKAEYQAMAAVTSELVWLRQLLLDFGFHVSSPMALFCDNCAAIYIASNPIFHELAKHI